MDKTISKHYKNTFSLQKQQQNKQTKIKILQFDIKKESVLSINDYSFYQAEKELIAVPINDLIHFRLANESFLLSTAIDSNKILIACLSSKKIIKKIQIPFGKQPIKAAQITSIKQITSFPENYSNLNQSSSNNEFKFAIGTSNGLIFFYSITNKGKGAFQDTDLNTTHTDEVVVLFDDLNAELNGIFSVFLKV